MEGEDIRYFTDESGSRWSAALITHGRTSGYLNPRVHKPILQFVGLDRRGPRRYVGYAVEEHGPLSDCPEPVLQGLLKRSSSQ